MNNTTNIYDIDNNLIRAAGDNKKLTIEEAQERIKHYIEKIKSLDKESSDYLLKLSTYNQYVDNLANYIIRERATRGDFSDKHSEPNTTTILESNDKPVVMDEYVEPIEEVA
jgi:hypothetical protein